MVIIVVLMVSFGSLVLLGAFMFAIFSCLNKMKMKRNKKKKKKAIIRETEKVDVEGSVRVHEVVIPGPHGTQIEALDVEGDVNVHEHISKEDIMCAGGPHVSDVVASEVARRAAVLASAGGVSHDKDLPV